MGPMAIALRPYQIVGVLLIVMLFAMVLSFGVLDNRRSTAAKEAQAEAAVRVIEPGVFAFPHASYTSKGMTRRQLYAAMVMQGFAAHGLSYEPIVLRTDAAYAWKVADALIATENE